MSDFPEKARELHAYCVKIFQKLTKSAQKVISDGGIHAGIVVAKVILSKMGLTLKLSVQ